ncbi:MAG: RNA degradosome polyphosphate kinase, partial [Proteobacteria bacterium]|nr:RNA degradosome polyphosphate kinase [Pseudomonadota bacterium]
MSTSTNLHLAQAITAPVTNYINRELSWLSFNERVLEEALDQSNPLLERLRFLTIFHTNLDEFFMVRVSGLKQQAAADIEVLSKDGLSPRAQLQKIAERLKPTLALASQCLHHDILPTLREHGIGLYHYEDLSKKDRKMWDEWYAKQVHPILTPLAVGPTQRFPFISNLSLNLAMWVRSASGEQ